MGGLICRTLFVQCDFERFFKLDSVYSLQIFIHFQRSKILERADCGQTTHSGRININQIGAHNVSYSERHQAPEDQGLG